MDRACFVECVKPHLPLLLRAASALVGFSEAEDAVQEALLRAWHAWSTLRDHAAIRRWLLRIVYNVCLGWQRGRFGTRGHRDVPLPDEMPGLVTFLDDPGSSDNAAKLDLRQAILALEEPLRQLIVLRFYAGLDASEIGMALDMPHSTVRTRLQRALAQLRAHLTSSSSLSHAHQEDNHV